MVIYFLFPSVPPCYIVPILGLPIGATEHQARVWAVRLACCSAMTLRDPEHVHQLIDPKHVLLVVSLGVTLFFDVFF